MAQTSTLSNFFQVNLHQKILLIAFPMILSNITTPLMGLVDTAVLGHMEGMHILAGASVATLIVTQVYWLCGFLRMTSTGLSAQAKGSSDGQMLNKSLIQSLLIGLILGCALLLLQNGILTAGLYFADASLKVETVITEYFNIRIWGAPAAMTNFALIGWLIGQQRARHVLIIQVLANLLNVALNLYFVFILELGVSGVAIATVIAEYFISLSSLFAALYIIGRPMLKIHWFTLQSLKPLLSLNGNTFARNLILQACIAFLIFRGVGFGQTSAAINAILMQFFTLIALGLDGVAYAAEALVGEQKGKKSSEGIMHVTLHGLIWSTTLALLYSIVFLIWGRDIVSLLSDNVELQLAMGHFMVFVYWLPIIAHWCFFFDGIFVGLTRASSMRNSMLFSGVVVYFPSFWLLSHYGNHALWVAMLLFLLSRGITLGGYFIYLYQKQRVVA